MSPTLVNSLWTLSACVSYVLVLVLIILFSRLFQNCMCPSSCGFKLSDHYRVLLKRRSYKAQKEIGEKLVMLLKQLRRRRAAEG